MSLYLIFLEQYNTTKSSWLADYCNKEAQSPQSSPALPWLGSSVDPPNVVQSEFQLHTLKILIVDFFSPIIKFKGVFELKLWWNISSWKTNSNWKDKRWEELVNYLSSNDNLWIFGDVFEDVNQAL